jgi:hypothetical protein
MSRRPGVDPQEGPGARAAGDDPILGLAAVDPDAPVETRVR